MVLGKGVSTHHIDYNRQECGYKADKYRIEEVNAKMAFCHGLCVVIQRGILPQKAGRPGKQFADAFKGRTDHPNDRHQKQKGQKKQKNPFKPCCTDFLCLSLHPMETLVNRGVEAYCNNDGTFFSVFKMPKTGTNKDLYLYNKREESQQPVDLSQISNISGVLGGDLKFSPFFFVYVSDVGFIYVDELIHALESCQPFTDQKTLKSKIENWLQHWVDEGIIQQHWNTFSLI